MADEVTQVKKHYVNNKLLYEAFVKWYEQRAKAEAEGKPEPQPPRYISEAILLIPKNMASLWKFSGYSFKEEMIGDAVENLTMYYRNFDPNKGSNPFGYFSQITSNAFIRRILKERKQAYVKHKLIQNSNILENLSTQGHDDDGDYHVSLIETLQMSLNPALEAYYEKKKDAVDSEENLSTSIEALMYSETPEAKDEQG